MKIEDLLECPAFKSDWAEKHTKRIVSDELMENNFPDGVDDLRRLVGKAIREALAKAAEVVDEADSCSADPYEPGISGPDTAAAIRALGAAK